MATSPRRRRSARVNKELPRMLAAMVERLRNKILHHGGGLRQTRPPYPSHLRISQQKATNFNVASSTTRSTRPYRQAGREVATPPSPTQSGNLPIIPPSKRGSEPRCQEPTCQEAKMREEEGPQDELRVTLWVRHDGTPCGYWISSEGVVAPSTRIEFKGCWSKRTR